MTNCNTPVAGLTRKFRDSEPHRVQDVAAHVHRRWAVPSGFIESTSDCAQPLRELSGPMRGTYKALALRQFAGRS